MSGSRLTVVLLLLTAVGMAGGMLALTHLLGRVRGSRVDRTPYECGMKPFEFVERHRFSVHFYLVAMLFILFDIETVFMVPWGVAFHQMASARLFLLVEMLVFVLILAVGYVYVWKRGALQWD